MTGRYKSVAGQDSVTFKIEWNGWYQLAQIGYRTPIDVSACVGHHLLICE